MAYFGASCDTPEYNKEFADELMLDFPLLSDSDRKVALEYGLVVGDKKTPSRWTVYVSKEGKISFVDIGPPSTYKGTVKVSGPSAVAGTLTISKNKVTGKLGGRRVSASF